MRTFLSVVAAALVLVAGGANAHTKAIGYHNSGPGCVTFWYQSWHSYVAPFFEGDFTLVGIAGNPYPSTTVPFALTTGTKPPLLVDGVNNFFACNRLPNSFCPTDEDNTGGSKWQGVQFCGLAAGTYQFTYNPIPFPSADWDPATPGVRSNTLVLTGVIVGGPAVASDIPTLSEWAMMLLMALLAGAAYLRLRRR